MGLSTRKAAYIHELADQVAGGEITLNQIGRLSDENAIRELMRIRGVGRWTAHMFQIFCLGRLDVLPLDDVGVRGAIQRFYRLDSQPNIEQMEQIAQPWRPYASVAAWYCWRGLDANLTVDLTQG